MSCDCATGHESRTAASATRCRLPRYTRADSIPMVPPSDGRAAPTCGMEGFGETLEGAGEALQMKLRLAVFVALMAAGALWVLAGASLRETRAAKVQPGLARATFAGGCFWCMEPPYDKIPGVVSVTSGYAGGSVKNPSYEMVSMGVTGHAESVQIQYDPAKVSFEQLVEVFWRNIDPTDAGGQFCDRGSQYRTVIFYEGESQKQAAEASKKALEDSKVLPKPVVTTIEPLNAFYPAEDYHQGFCKKNP